MGATFGILLFVQMALRCAQEAVCDDGVLTLSWLLQLLCLHLHRA